MKAQQQQQLKSFQVPTAPNLIANPFPNENHVIGDSTVVVVEESYQLQEQQGRHQS
jgi:hypothetical protein